MAVDVIDNNKNGKMFQTMAIINLKMGNVGFELQSLKTRLVTMEGKKQGLLKQMQEGAKRL